MISVNININTDTQHIEIFPLSFKVLNGNQSI